MAGKGLSQEEIVQAFGKMRMEQQHSAQKLSEIEQDMHEHKVVIEVLEGVDKGRRCFRMVGDVLVERTVADILPALRDNMKQLSDQVEKDRGHLLEKSRELSAYQQKHNIRVQFRGSGAVPPSPTMAAVTSGSGGAEGGKTIAAS